MPLSGSKEIIIEDVSGSVIEQRPLVSDAGDRIHTEVKVQAEQMTPYEYSMPTSVDREILETAPAPVSEQGPGADKYVVGQRPAGGVLDFEPTFTDRAYAEVSPSLTQAEPALISEHALQKGPKFPGDQVPVSEEITADLVSDVQHTPQRPVDIGSPQSVPEPQLEAQKSPLPDEYDEIEETLPDGTTVKRRILKTRVKKVITKKIRRVGPDGEVIEDVITEEVPESEISETSSIRSSLSDTRDMVSPVPSLSSPGGLVSPADSIDSEKPTVRVYTDTIEGEPDVETDVQEFEEELPDGTIVKRKVIKTRQKQTIVKRVVMEGPERDLPSTEEQAQLMLNTGHVFEPEVKMYTDTMEAEPESQTDVQEFEEQLADGTLVKRKVVTTTEQQMRTDRMLMEGATIPGLTDGGDLQEFQSGLSVESDQLAMAQHEPDFVEEDMVEPELKRSAHIPRPYTEVEHDSDEDLVMIEKSDLLEASLPAEHEVHPDAIEEDLIIPDERKREQQGI